MSSEVETSLDYLLKTKLEIPRLRWEWQKLAPSRRDFAPKLQHDHGANRNLVGSVRKCSTAIQFAHAWVTK